MKVISMVNAAAFNAGKLLLMGGVAAAAIAAAVAMKMVAPSLASQVGSVSLKIA